MPLNLALTLTLSKISRSRANLCLACIRQILSASSTVRKSLVASQNILPLIVDILFQHLPRISLPPHYSCICLCLRALRALSIGVPNAPSLLSVVVVGNASSSIVSLALEAATKAKHTEELQQGFEVRLEVAALLAEIRRDKVMWHQIEEARGQLEDAGIILR